MRFVIYLTFLSFSCVICKNNVKSLTESLGQEVIEIGTPIKDLPPDIEEEPSAENDDDDITTTTTQLVTVKKEPKKTTTAEVLIMTEKKSKDIDQIDGVTLDDEEARIEKELAEIYKDNIEDYKADSSEKEFTTKNVSEDKMTTNKNVSEETVVNKPIRRSKNNFNFQPNMNSDAAIEKFRTSIDEISCKQKNSVDKTTTPVPGSARPVYMNIVSVILSSIFALSFQ